MDTTSTTTVGKHKGIDNFFFFTFVFDREVLKSCYELVGILVRHWRVLLKLIDDTDNRHVNAYCVLFRVVSIVKREFLNKNYVDESVTLTL